MDNRLHLAIREFGSLRSEKTIILALVIQLIIAAFSSFLVVGLVSLTDPGSTTGAYTVQMGVSGAASDELERIMDLGESREATVFQSETAAMSAFEDREIDAVLHAEPGSDGRIHIDAIAPDGDFRTTLIVTQVKAALTDLETELRLDRTNRLTRAPLSVPDRSDSNPYYGFTYTILVPVLVFLPAFISGSIAADSLAEEFERGTFGLLRVAPLSVPQIIDGKALTMIGIAPAQAGLWLLFLELNGTTIARPIEILVLATAMTGVLVVIGAALAIWVGVRREAQLLYSLLALVVFGASLLLPENPPNLVAKLAIGSPTATSYAILGTLVLSSSVGYWVVRNSLSRHTLGD
ncbi:MAG: ABC transporter permease [Halodesulfurarchaeum sp.]|nr:ABC transporter permease [Halodesulfurarchaeum sp.]